MKIEVSNGEIADKLTIIELKLGRITDPEKLTNLRKEHAILEKALAGFMEKSDPLYQELYRVNSDLWEIEDRIRDLEREKNFGKEFIETARSVYFRNDLRSEIKRKINMVTGSGLIEEKSYEKY
ncbi:MAG: hypothetical protein GX622_01455 [Bacteroidales bacterium]|jgi:hypothetical protein|nr:hypothetical protein [Bacteroidales bacterium]